MMENRNGFRGQDISSNRRSWRLYRSEEYHEADVWDVVINEERGTGLRNGIEFTEAPTSPYSISRRLPSAARMIPGPCRNETFGRNGHNDGEPTIMLQHSAPVNIPDWSKIYGTSPQGKKNWSNATCDNETDDGYDVHNRVGESDDDNGDYGGFDHDDDEHESSQLPPHEWLARKLASSQISSFSVCEGAGRTLKGRDLSRVRNAVLSRTGFI